MTLPAPVSFSRIVLNLQPFLGKYSSAQIITPSMLMTKSLSIRNGDQSVEEPKVYQGTDHVFSDQYFIGVAFKEKKECNQVYKTEKRRKTKERRELSLN